jgi:peptide/nickel transport system permease protein
MATGETVIANRLGSDGRRERSAAGNLLRTLLGAARRKPLGAAGLVVIITIVVAAVFAPIVAPYGYNETDIANRLQSPSRDHVFGTDGAGRDVFSRVVYGARVSMHVGIASVVIGMLCAAAVGLLSGYVGGFADSCIQRVVDALMSIPTLILLMTITAIIGRGQNNVAVGLGIAFMAGNSRVMRAATLSVKAGPYIEAARTIGAGHVRIILRHILPNVMAPLVITASLGLGFAILAEASLSFLGFGVPPPAPSWGGMLSGVGQNYFLVAPWIAIFPGLAIALTVFAVNMFGDALRDLMDPRLRGSANL